jgi:WD40 repeat protein
LLGIWAGDRTLVYALDGDRVSVVDTGDMGSVVFGADTLIAWGVRTGIRVRQRTTNHELLIPAPQNAYLTFAGRRLAASNDSTKLYVFDELPVEPVRAWKRSKAVRFVKAAGAGRVAYLTTEGEVGIADGGTGEITPLVTDPRFYVGDQVALGIIDDRIVVGGDALRAIDPLTRTVTDIWTRSPACITQLPSGQAVVIAATGELRLYDRELAKVELEARIASAARDCVARPDGSVAVSHDGGVVSVIDTHGREVASDRGDGDTTDALAAMPDGSIIIGDFRGHVRRWVPGTASRTLFQHLGPVWGVAVSPDGRWIATCGRDRTARISTPDGEVVEIHRGHEDEVASVAFSSTGDVVSAGMDGRILRWPIDPARAPPSSVDELVHQIDTLTSIAADQ